MSTIRDNTCPVVAGSVPYVGMRPYGREEKDWFYGRSADGRIIADKILSARLTLLYAPSGLGKSSVLNASVIPLLEGEDCCVMYFDAWAGSDPEMAIKDKLAAMAALIGVVEPLAGAPTIAELARLVTGSGKTLVLVFDQFEEFLVNAAYALDPLRKEVAALVRAQTIDARVLICLREEFLAALEPFRQDILTLFHSTYRLEPLSAKDVRDAIVEPALRFGGYVEPALVQRLIEDLSAGQRDSGEAADVAPVTPRTWLGKLRKRWFMPSAAPSARRAAGTRELLLRTGAAGTIDLPMLQLVCEHMWRAAPLIEGLRKLMLVPYERDLGGKDKILSDHIRSCMPARWRDRLFTAKLMLYLAPPSGMKISYSAADLAAFKLDKVRVEAELVRLSGADVRILRQREYHRDLRYELQHDALVRHVASWRDEVLTRAAVVSWIGRGAVAVVVIGLGAWSFFEHYVEVRRNTDDQVAELARMSEEQRFKHAPARLEGVAGYLLIQEQGTARLDHLKQLLEQNVQLLPANYATAVPLGEPLTPVLQANPLVLRYSQDRVFDVDSFSNAWSEAAQRLTRRWGIPVPQRIALIADPGLLSNEMHLESGQANRLLKIDIEAFDERALVLMKDLTGPAQEFRERFKDHWIKPRLLASDDWWVVPRWSLPVWNWLSLSLRAGAAYPAYALEAELQKDPTVLLTPAATYFLVKHVAAKFPCTAAETWTQHGDELTNVLAAFVRGQGADQRFRPMTHPHLLFDLLATTTDRDEARRLLSQSETYLIALDATPRGNWPRHRSSAKADKCALPSGFGNTWDMTAFGNAEAWLPPLLPKLRLSLGADLIRAWSASSALSELPTSQHNQPTTAGTPTWGTLPTSRAAGTETKLDRAVQINAGSALPALTEAFERHRRQAYARSGVWLPEVSFVDASSEFAGPQGHQFRIALLDSSLAEGKLADAGGTDSASIERVMAELDAATLPTTRAWIDAEFVGSLLGRDDGLTQLVKDWTMPSVTDLVLLLREVEGGSEAGTTAAKGQAGRTIRDPAWLLTSLVFWKSYYESGDPKNSPKDLLMDLAGHLRRLEAGAASTPMTPSHGGAAAELERGITALYAGRYREAEQGFVQALKLGTHSQVADIFIARYSAQWGAAVRWRANALCEEPKTSTRRSGKNDERYKPKSGLLNNPMLQVDLLSVLEGAARERDPKATRNLALCLLSSMPLAMPMARDELLLSTATRYGEPKDWPQEQAWWFTLELLRRYDPTRDAPNFLEQGKRFLDSAMGRFSAVEAETAFYELNALCNEPGPKTWCREQLTRFAQARPSPWNSLDLALTLGDRPEYANDVLQWADRATELARKHRLSAHERERVDFFVTQVRTQRLINLGMDVDQKVFSDFLDRDNAEANWDLKFRAVLLAIDANLSMGKQDHARLLELVKEGLSEWPENLEILSNAAVAGLRVGDLELVKQAVDAASRLATGEALSPDERSNMLFIAAYAGLVANHEGAGAAAVQYIRTPRSRYAPLVAMLLHIRSEPVQREFAIRRLNELWQGVDARSWDARLRGGDERVWHEMLMGYFKGAVPEDDIFGPLRDEPSFQASKLAVLGFTRLNALTEANFYDALRRKVNGDDAGAQASLERVVKSGSKRYIEYSLAVQLQRNYSGQTTSGADIGVRR